MNDANPAEKDDFIRCSSIITNHIKLHKDKHHEHFSRFLEGIATSYDSLEHQFSNPCCGFI